MQIERCFDQEGLVSYNIFVLHCSTIPLIVLLHNVMFCSRIDYPHLYYSNESLGHYSFVWSSQ